MTGSGSTPDAHHRQIIPRILYRSVAADVARAAAEAQGAVVAEAATPTLEDIFIARAAESHEPVEV